MTDRLRYNPLVKRGFQFDNTGAESGLPTGGTTGQVIKKASNADFDVTWGADNASGGGGSSVGSTLYLYENFGGF